MYYFPVKINGRRMHHCELRDSNDSQQTVFNFIVQKTTNTELVFIKGDSSLISEKGSNSNVTVYNLNFTIGILSDGSDGVPVYELFMEKGDFRNAVNSPDNALNIQQLDNDYLLGVNDFRGDEFVLRITYRNPDGKLYSCQISFNVCSDTEDLISAALDFGSEATQMRIGCTASNIKLVDVVREIAEKKGGFRRDEGEDGFWQGRVGDDYFKSKYWVNFHPALTRLTDVPMQNGRKTFVQMLNTFDMSDTNELYPLPNLKLLELVPGVASGENIDFDADTSNEVRSRNPQLTNVPQQEKILRLLIASFLQSVLYNIHKHNPKDELCLQFVVLAPNVYSQDRIYKIVENVYKDFNSIRNNDINEYKTIKGIEVQVLSESDASFLGFVDAQENVNSGDYFLIIDAGKGTTDFSVVRATDDMTKYDSIYRFGIPASGNFITYALYEALCEIELDDKQTKVSDIVNKDNDYSSLLELSNKLDALKINNPMLNYNEYSESQPWVSVKDINTYLDNLLKQKLKLPRADEYLYKNIGILTDRLEDSLNVIKSQNISFKKVFLTGRGFCCQPFADSVVNMLIENRFIGDYDDVMKTTNADLAKSVCMAGSLRTFSGRGADINHKSMLVGSAVIEYKRTWLSGLFGKSKNREVAVKLDEDFYYNGVRFSAPSGYMFKLNGRIRKEGKSRSGSHHIYFVGSKFIDQTEDNAIALSFASTATNLQFNDAMLDMAKKSMFPFV